MDNVTRTNGLSGEPVVGEFEIERLDHGYMVRIWQGRNPMTRLAFEDALGVADEVMRWLGYEVHEDEPVYIADHNFPTDEELHALKRGSGRYGDGATW